MVVIVSVGIAAAAVIGPATLVSGDLRARNALMLGGFGVFALAGVVIGLIGVALYVLAPAQPGLAWRNYASLRTAIAILVLAAAIANAMQIPVVLSNPELLTASGSDRFTLPPIALFIAIASLQVCLAAIVYLRIVAPGVMSWRDFGLNSEFLDKRIVAGLLTWIVLLAVSFGLETGLRGISVEQDQAKLFAGIKGAPIGQFLLVLVAGVVLAPVGEEIFFRGYLFSALLKERGPLVAYTATSLLFAAVHFNLPALLPILVLGVGLAIARHLTKSLLPSIIAHGLNNLVALSALYFLDLPAP